MPRYVKGRKPDVQGHFIQKNVSLGVSDEQVAAIAAAVALAIGDKGQKIIYQGGPGGIGNTEADIVSNQKSLEQIAESMTVQRGDKDSNFDDLGNVKKTKKDDKDLQNTIDILSDIDD